MIEALYGIEFVSNVDDSGYGVVVFETGRMLGGDSSFVFVGSYQISNGDIAAEVKCTNDRGVFQSIFGDIKEFTLKLFGTPDTGHEEFMLKGHMVENPSMEVSVKLTRRAELPG